jgi:hypothetical protein
MTADRSLPSPWWFVGPLAAVYAVAVLLVAYLPQTAAPGAVATGLTVDLVVLVPALYYVVCVRGRGWPALTVAPVFLGSVAAASALVPAEHQTLLRALGYALPVVEGGLLLYVLAKAVRVVRARRAAGADEPADLLERLQARFEGAFDVPVVARALAYELALLRYAVAPPPAEAVPPAHAARYHRQGGYGAVVGAILLAAVAELVGVHVLLAQWSATAAWVHAALSVYGAVWFIGDYRAMRHRPHVAGDEALCVRFGLRWTARVPWAQVAAVRRTRHAPEGDACLHAVAVGRPQFVVDLAAPVEASGPYGLPRTVAHVALAVDDPAAFAARLRTLGVPVTG